MKHGDPEVKTPLDRAGLGTRAATAATMCPCVQAQQYKEKVGVAILCLPDTSTAFDNYFNTV